MTRQEASIEERVSDFKTAFDRIVTHTGQVIRGKTGVIKLAVTCMLADGHLLIEDVPGVGKTSLAKSLAETIDGSLQRIQFTPDLLPSDVTGVQIFNRKTNEFEFHKGPVFSNIVVADEINRASPKTQSSLLEVMEEHQVSVDGVPHFVPEPFIVLATQNPIELDGTYPLPEAQLDRFLMRISMGYPSANAEMEILDQHQKRWDRVDLQPVMNPTQFVSMTRLADHVHIGPNVKSYIVAIATETRNRADVRIGVSPRGTIALASAARAWAAANGRAFVTNDDVRYLAPHVLAHRMILTPEMELRGVTGSQIINEVLTAVPAGEAVRS